MSGVEPFFLTFILLGNQGNQADDLAEHNVSNCCIVICRLINVVLLIKLSSYLQWDIYI